MRRLFILGIVMVCGVWALSAQEAPHWTYEGEEGAEHWGEIDERYALCGTGSAQSPIDVADPISVNLVDLEFDYHDSALNIFNNGHTIQVAYDDGSGIVYNEVPYKLLQFHFHTPSEHTIDGQPAAMEVHFVHQAANGSLAVVGALIVAGETPNGAYNAIFDALPAEPGEPQPTDLFVNAGNLLPADSHYYTYTGSLTTPPCSEGVRWLLLDTPVMLTQAQIDAFAALFPLNARPVQPLNARDLLVDAS